MRARMRVLAPVIAMAALAAGCAGPAAGGSAPGGLEKTTLNVAVVPAVDSAGFFVALHEGLFRKEGLTINYTPAVSSDTVIDQQVAGKYDITGGNYEDYKKLNSKKYRPMTARKASRNVLSGRR
jgi:NitT/TauT family transport system substrate-binding protein